MLHGARVLRVRLAPPTPELNPHGVAVSPGQAGCGDRGGSDRGSACFPRVKASAPPSRVGSAPDQMCRSDRVERPARTREMRAHQRHMGDTQMRPSASPVVVVAACRSGSPDNFECRRWEALPVRVAGAEDEALDDPGPSNVEGGRQDAFCAFLCHSRRQECAVAFRGEL